MKPGLKFGISGFLMMTAMAAQAQPSGSPGGGVIWAFIGGVLVGFAVGYYVGKQSGSGDDDSKKK